MATLNTKRLTIDLLESEHKRLKIMSSLEGLSMKDFLLRGVFDDKNQDETSYLLKAKKNKKRLLDALVDKKGSKVFSSLKEFEHEFGI